MQFDASNSVNQQLDIKFANNIQVFIKREDLLHPNISGNKFRKLKYNLMAARKAGYQTLLTFGGAYSNHIAAVAAAGYEFGFNTIGIIRGEELADKINNNAIHNLTLSLAQQYGMHFKFISRADYRDKTKPEFIEQLKQEFGEFYLIPEGGSNTLAVQGCSEILTKQDKQQFDYICCAVGTCGTISGVIESSSNRQTVFGFPALKGDFLRAEIEQWTSKTNWKLINDYHFGGYAKTTPELLQFVQDFKQKTNIEIEPIYTGKMLFGLFDLIDKGYFAANSQILAIHTGGLQGNLSSKFSVET